MPDSTHRTPKLFRDPIHDVISWDLDDPVGRLIVQLIDSQPFQRLRHVRQLGLASLVYHGAEHSRFSHSMGAAHMARRFFSAIHRGEHPEEGLLAATCAAALLHDIGHPPFSHALETTLHEVLGLDGGHESLTEQIVLWEDGPVFQILADFDLALPATVASIIAGTSGLYIEPIISSQLDADRMDYLLRDGYMSGVQNYHYDAGRILEMLMHDSAGLVVGRRALQAVESYLLSRFHMYQQVYYHKTVRASEIQVSNVFRRVFDLLQEGRRDLLPEGALGRLFSSVAEGRAPSIEDYVRVCDPHAWNAFSVWSNDRDPVLSALCSGFADRTLLKTIEIPGEELGAFVAQSKDELDAMVRAEGYDPAYFTALDRAENMPFRPYEPKKDHSRDEANAIRIRMGDGRIQPIEDVSQVARALTKIRYRVFRYCLPASVRERAEAVVRERHGRSTPR